MPYTRDDLLALSPPPQPTVDIDQIMPAIIESVCTKAKRGDRAAMYPLHNAAGHLVSTPPDQIRDRLEAQFPGCYISVGAGWVEINWR